MSRSRTRGWRRAAVAALAVFVAGSLVGVGASSTGVAFADSLNADQLKAAYLFNFARYVEWPGDAHVSKTSALRIGVVGSEAVSDLLRKTVKGKSVGSRRLEVMDFEAASEGRETHILFVAGDLSSGDIDATLQELGGTSTFVVADDESFAKKGGTANFFMADQRVRFAINKAAVKQAGLKVSSKLLRLAELVD
ncbi:MAG: YfiR family protein [Myxococcota bacterium]|nr:YfiR family protein [Myxococcota bacterium]